MALRGQWWWRSDPGGAYRRLERVVRGVSPRRGLEDRPKPRVVLEGTEDVVAAELFPRIAFLDGPLYVGVHLFPVAGDGVDLRGAEEKVTLIRLELHRFADVAQGLVVAPELGGAEGPHVQQICTRARATTQGKLVVKTVERELVPPARFLLLAVPLVALGQVARRGGIGLQLVGFLKGGDGLGKAVQVQIDE